MFQEMKVEDALREYLKGRKVVLMDVIRMPDEATQYQGTEMAEVFRGSVLLVELPDEPRKEQGKPTKKESHPSTGKKKSYLNLEDKKRIKEKYLAGMEMEDIAKELGLTLTAVSRYVDEEGLGKERYKGKTVPSGGSAPVPSATAFGVK